MEGNKQGESKRVLQYSLRGGTAGSLTGVFGCEWGQETPSITTEAGVFPLILFLSTLAMCMGNIYNGCHPGPVHTSSVHGNVNNAAKPPAIHTSSVCGVHKQ